MTLEFLYSFVFLLFSYKLLTEVTANNQYENTSMFLTHD